MPHVLFAFAVQHALVMTAVQHNQWRGINPIHCFDPCRGWFSLFYWYDPSSWFPRQCPAIAFKIRGWSIRRDPSITHVRSMTIAGDIIRIMICTSEVKKYIKSVSVSVKSITLNAASLRFTVSHKHGGHATSFHGLKHSGIDGGTATDFIFAEAPYL